MRWKGHVLAFVAILVWGVTFVNTKSLLRNLTPVEIFFDRFLLAALFLFLLRPVRGLKLTVSSALAYLVAGFLGNTLYFYFENTALKYTTAGNTGFIVATIPLMTALFSSFTRHHEKMSVRMLAGLVVAFAGAFLLFFDGISFRGSVLGEALAFLCAVSFAIYNIAVRYLPKGENPIVATRRIFVCGILTGLPFYLLSGPTQTLSDLTSLNVWPHLLFLAFVGNGLCYLAWNEAIHRLGAVVTSSYIYLIPLFSVASAAIWLGESVSWTMAAGGALIIAGVWYSQRKKPEAEAVRAEAA